jgi:hypothetical protein
VDNKANEIEKEKFWEQIVEGQELERQCRQWEIQKKRALPDYVPVEIMQSAQPGLQFIRDDLVLKSPEAAEWHGRGLERGMLR